MAPSSVLDVPTPGTELTVAADVPSPEAVVGLVPPAATVVETTIVEPVAVEAEMPLTICPASLQPVSHTSRHAAASAGRSGDGGRRYPSTPPARCTRAH